MTFVRFLLLDIDSLSVVPTSVNGNMKSETKIRRSNAACPHQDSEARFHYAEGTYAELSDEARFFAVLLANNLLRNVRDSKSLQRSVVPVATVCKQ